VVEAGTIGLIDANGSRDVGIAMATADIGAALAGAELIVVPSPAIAQEDIARAMAPHLRSGQVVFLPPGTFGSFVMARIVRAAGSKAEVAWAETGTLPYLATQGPGRARCG
jgi:opine dehydrogenase